MIISGSNIEMASSHRYEQTTVGRESFSYWRGDIEPQQQTDEQPVAFSDEALALQPIPMSTAVDEDVTELDPKDAFKIEILQGLIQALTGKKFKIMTPTEATRQDGEHRAENSLAHSQQMNAPSRNRESEWGMEYNYYRAHHEVEQLSFSTQGVVTTADGREINIDIQLNMSREFASEESFSFRAGALKDPLAINYSGNATDLTDERFEFDLDADGQTEQINFFRPGTGVLAMDKNGDGTINNGREVIGALSGDGFGDLAKQDEDGNGWIDENDPIFNQLRIWSKETDGSDRLVALGEQGVGAIYLGNIETPYQLKDDNNETQGAIRSSSFFLREDGTAGTVQQVDLKV